MTTGYATRAWRQRGDPSRTGWTAGSTAALIVLIALIGLPLLASGRGSPAWTVDSGADGSVTLRIRDLRDAAGLERRLAEAGFPAHVTFAPEGTRCAAGTAPSDAYGNALPVVYGDDAIVIHAGRIGDGDRLALAALQRVGGDITVEAAVVPRAGARCALAPI